MFRKQEQPTPEQLAQRQLEAYNNRDIDAFLEPYADDVEVYNFPDELVYKGKAPMRATYAAMFARFTELHCVVTQRIVQGTTVIDKERITGLDRASVLEATTQRSLFFKYLQNGYLAVAKTRITNEKKSTRQIVFSAA